MNRLQTFKRLKQEREVLGLLSKIGTKKSKVIPVDILELVSLNPGISFDDISLVLSIHPSGLVDDIKALTGKGLITGDGQGFTVTSKAKFDRAPKKGEAYYYYSGPLDEKTRPFCKKMLQMDKVFSEKEIKKISGYLNYDVLEFVGAYNCRHRWVRFRGKEIATAPPTVKQINDLIRAGIKV